MTAWRFTVDDDQLLGVATVDFSKAFNMVCHDLLLKKLGMYGVQGSDLLNLVWQLSVSDRCRRVCLGQEKSDWAVIRRGV